MSSSSLRDQRGIAMVFEVVLVALVLSLVGFAVWQANNQSKSAPNAQTVITKAPVSAGEAAATAAAAIVDKDLTADLSISADAEASQEDQFESIANDTTNLEGSYNDADF